MRIVLDLHLTGRFGQTLLNRCLLGRLPFRIELLRLKAQLLQSVRIVFQKKIQTPEVFDRTAGILLAGGISKR